MQHLSGHVYSSPGLADPGLPRRWALERSLSGCQAGQSASGDQTCIQSQLGNQSTGWEAKGCLISGSNPSRGIQHRIFAPSAAPLLRPNCAIDGSPVAELPSVEQVAERLRQSILGLYDRHLSEDGKAVDYAALKQDPGFRCSVPEQPRCPGAWAQLGCPCCFHACARLSAAVRVQDAISRQHHVSKQACQVQMRRVGIQTLRGGL